MPTARIARCDACTYMQTAPVNMSMYCESLGLRHQNRLRWQSLCMVKRCGGPNHDADASDGSKTQHSLQARPCRQHRVQWCAGPRRCPWGSGPHQGQCSLKWADTSRKQSQRSLSRWKKVGHSQHMGGRQACGGNLSPAGCALSCVPCKVFCAGLRKRCPVGDARKLVRWARLPDAGVCPVAEEPGGCSRQLDGCSSLLIRLLQLQGMSGAIGWPLPGA